MSLLVALLNVPIGSIICINGQIKVSIQHDDFIGFDFTTTNNPALVQSSSFTTIDNKNNIDNDDNENIDCVELERYHFITVQCNNNSNEKNRFNNTAITTGFFIPHVPKQHDTTPNNSTKCFILQYNPQTEEVMTYSNVDDRRNAVDHDTNTNVFQQQQTTIDNILLFYNNPLARQQYPYRIINYNQLLLIQQSQSSAQSQTPSLSASSVESQLSSTKLYDTCNYISKELLYHRGTILPGTKVIPSTYNDSNDIYNDKEIMINQQQLNSSTSKKQPSIIDGICVQYPAIPLVLHVQKKEQNQQRKEQHQHQTNHQTFNRNNSISNKRITKLVLHHNGSKGFLKHLSPIERTILFYSNNNSNTTNNVLSTIIFPKVLQLYYSNSSQIYSYQKNSSWNNTDSHQGTGIATSSTTMSIPNTSTNNINYNSVLGDIQLSFLLFTTINCYTSYIHWKDLLHLVCISFSDAVATPTNTSKVSLDSVPNTQYDHERIKEQLSMIDFYSKFLYIFANQLLTLYPSSNVKKTAKTSTNVGILESIVDDDVFTSSQYDDNDTDCNDIDNDLCLNKNFVLSSVDIILESLQDYFIKQKSQQSHQDDKLQVSYQLFVNTIQLCFQQYYIHRWQNKNQQQVDDDADTIYDTENDSDCPRDHDNDFEYTMKDTSTRTTSRTTGVTIPKKDMSLLLSPPHSFSSSPMLVENELKPQLRLNSSNDDTDTDSVYSNCKNKDNMYDTDKYDDDEDGPVIVDFQEIQASIERSQQPRQPQQQQQHVQQEENKEQEQEHIHLLQTQYPLLYASMISTNGIEDIIMTCSRVLYDKNDVSLVREAAHYLQTIEDNKRY